MADRQSKPSFRRPRRRSVQLQFIPPVEPNPPAPRSLSGQVRERLDEFDWLAVNSDDKQLRDLLSNMNMIIGVRQVY